MSKSLFKGKVGMFTSCLRFLKENSSSLKEPPIEELMDQNR